MRFILYRLVKGLTYSLVMLLAVAGFFILTAGPVLTAIMTENLWWGMLYIPHLVVFLWKLGE